MSFDFNDKTRAEFQFKYEAKVEGFKGTEIAADNATKLMFCMPDNVFIRDFSIATVDAVTGTNTFEIIRGATNTSAAGNMITVANDNINADGEGTSVDANWYMPSGGNIWVRATAANMGGEFIVMANTVFITKGTVVS